MIEKRIGNLFGATGGNYAGNIYDENYMAPCLNTSQGGYRQPMIVEAFAVASRGRNPDNPSDRTSGIPTEQRLEINLSGRTNCLTSVQKDNWILEIRDED